MPKAIDITGQRFGRLVAIRRSHLHSKSRRLHWLCRCDCGQFSTPTVNALRSGNTRSCGCTGRNFRHGYTSRDKRNRHPLYNIWSQMLHRCNNPNAKEYKNYGARGITVCTRWRDFPAFLVDVGERPSSGLSIDRINNDGNYEPGNVRWATPKEQSNNTRRNQREQSKCLSQS